MGWGEAAQAELEADPQYQRLLKAFRLFDKNGDGNIDAGELRELLLRANPDADPTKGDPLTEADCQTIINSFDDNGDGVLSIEELVAAWSTIGGSNTQLNDAMKERRAAKAAAIKKRQERSAAQTPVNGGEFQSKFGDASKKGEAGVAKNAQAPASHAMGDAPMVAKVAGGGSGGGSSVVAAAKPEPEETAETAMDRAKRRAQEKTGKSVGAGAGSLAGHKAQAEAPVDFENMTAAERAKAKAKAEIAAKDARKAAAKAAKKAAAA